MLKFCYVNLYNKLKMNLETIDYKRYENINTTINIYVD